MSFFASAQFHLYAHLISISQKLFDLPGAHLEVMCAGLKSDANSFELDIFLLFAMLAFSLFLFVFELAEVHDFADRRLGSCGNFNQIKATFVGNTDRLGSFQYSKVATFLVNDADRARANILIYTIALLNSRIINYL